jgi:hypothetical protein
VVKETEAKVEEEIYGFPIARAEREKESERERKKEGAEEALGWRRIRVLNKAEQWFILVRLQ